MKGFIQEYGNIIVVVAVVLLMLLFGKTGYAKNIQEAILGSANHIVETGDNITKGLEVKTGDVLNIEGNEYIVLEKQDNYQALVMTTSSIEYKKFQSTDRLDGQNRSTYEESEIDAYLENEWYSNLSSTMKVAIQSTNIKQASYVTFNDPDSKQETGPNGQVYNTISRHAFLPSVSEIEKAIDLNNSDKVKIFLNGTSVWTRDSYQNGTYNVEVLYADDGSLRSYYVGYNYGVRPAFVVDLSKVDYTEAGHVDYK